MKRSRGASLSSVPAGTTVPVPHVSAVPTLTAKPHALDALHRVRIVAIGTSTGGEGPTGRSPQLPEDFPWAL